MEIAETPEDLTPAWLGEALGATITAVATTPVGTGQMCDSLRLSLTYADADIELPATVVAKLPAADPTSRATALALRSYENEVRFYQQLAPDLPIRTPRVFHADIDVATAAFVLLLEDLAPATQGDQLTGTTPELAEVAVDELVGLHAPRWGDPALADDPDLEWLHRDPELNAAFLLGLLPGMWDGFRDRYAADLSPDVHRAGDALFGNLAGYVLAERHASTIVHGDYRLDNLLFSPDGSGVAVVDWQTCTVGPALSDVAYFVGAGLTSDDRRAHEDRLARRYHDGLLAAGITGYDWDRCWTDYRRGTWAGMVMTVAASMLVERTDRGDRMFLTMAERHARHALDLDADELLKG